MATLQPKIRPIISEGKLYFCETSRANSIIRLKNKIINEFPALKTSKPNYHLEVFHSYSMLDQRLHDLKKDGVIPMLLFFMIDEGKEDMDVQDSMKH